MLLKLLRTGATAKCHDYEQGLYGEHPFNYQTTSNQTTSNDFSRMCDTSHPGFTLSRYHVITVFTLSRFHVITVSLSGGVVWER